MPGGFHSRTLTLIACLIAGATSTCSSSSPEPQPAPPTTYFYPNQPGYQVPTAQPAPSTRGSATAAPQPATIGDALAPFGIIVAPEWDQPLPDLSKVDWSQLQWGNVPFPFLFGNAPPPWLLPQPAPSATPTPSAPPPASTGPSPAPPPTPAPTQVPAPPTASGELAGWLPEEIEVLDRVNQHRSRGATCGSTRMASVRPLAPNQALMRAARGHSEDMAANDYFDHLSKDGRSPSDRTRAAGYPGSFVGENIAAGSATAAGTVQQWLESPGHCVNMLSPEYTVLGVGHATASRARLSDYWTQNFAR